MLASILLHQQVMDASHLRLDASLRADTPAPATPTSASAAAPVAASPPPDMERPGFLSALNEPSAELDFSDFLDVINPLQHIPVIGSIYRAITGDEISGPARIVGGALFGGPIGFVGGIINAIAAEASGDDLGELAIAALFGEDNDASVAIAQNTGESGGAAEAPLVLAAIQNVPLPVASATETSGKQPLTGAAALQALTADLRGANAIQATLANPIAAPRVRVATAQLRPLALPSLDEFTLQMLDGLDKYKDLATTRQQPDKPQ